MGKLKFEYPDRSKPLKQCVKLARKARKVPKKDLNNVVQDSFFRSYFHKDLIESISEMLCDLERINVFVLSPAAQSTNDKWMNIKYDIKEDSESKFWLLLKKNPSGFYTNKEVAIP